VNFGELIKPVEHKPPFICDEKMILKHTRKCTSGASHGLSGWRGEFITPFLKQDEGLAQAWQDLVIMFGNAELPPWLHPYVCGARGFAPYKPRSDGLPRDLNAPFDPEVDRCRPIAAGDFVMRVASSIACELDRAAIAKKLQPYQLGMGVAGGAEAIAWIVRQQLHKPSIVIKTDEAHAFQFIDRAKAVNAAAEVCSAGARMMAYEYRYPPIVHFAGNGQSFPLVSRTGVKQGHGLGGVIDAVGKQEVYEQMAAVDTRLTIRAFYDDCYIMGAGDVSVDVFDEAVKRWEVGTNALGGKPNLSKCSVYYTHPSLKATALELAGKHGLKVIRPQDGFMACGVPVGDPDWVQRELAVQVEKHERLFDQLKKLDPQCANLVSRQCVLPRMNFLMRTVPFNEMSPHLERFDEMIESAIRKIGELGPTVPSLIGPHGVAVALASAVCNLLLLRRTLARFISARHCWRMHARSSLPICSL